MSGKGLALTRYRKFLALTAALILAVVASVALFLTIQNLGPYIAYVRGQFYTSLPNPATETVFDRVFSSYTPFFLRLALWPFLAFVALQLGATCAASTLPFKKRTTVTRRLIAGAGLSLLTSMLVLAALWPVLVRMIAH